MQQPSSFSEQQCSTLRKSFLKFQSYATIRKNLDGTKLNEQTQGNFKKCDILTEDGYASNVYMKDPGEIIRAHISTVSLSDFIVKRKVTFRLSHPTNAQIRVSACVAVERAVKTRCNPNAI